jgi:hypothetical protein
VITDGASSTMPLIQPASTSAALDAAIAQRRSARLSTIDTAADIRDGCPPSGVFLVGIDTPTSNSGIRKALPIRSAICLASSVSTLQKSASAWLATRTALRVMIDLFRGNAAPELLGNLGLWLFQLDVLQGRIQYRVEIAALYLVESM